MYAETGARQNLCAVQAELALHKREAAAQGSAKPRGRAGGDSRVGQSSSEKLATAQREAEELSTSLAKASSLIEVNCPIPCQLLKPLPRTA